MGWRCGLLASLAMLMAVPSFAATGAAPAPPKGWRWPTPTETEALSREASRALGQPARQRLSISADFDGDGRPDRAAFLLSRRTFALFVLRAKTGRWERLDDGEERTRLANYTLGVAPPGAFTPTCALGLDDGDRPCRQRIRTRRPAIRMTVYESAEVIIWWNGQTFDREWLSD